MAEKRWTPEQVAEYVRGNLPCNDIFDARRVVNGKVENGTFRVWAVVDGVPRPIHPNEWRRDPTMGHLGYLKWEGEKQLKDCTEIAYEIEPAAVVDLCARQPIPKGKGGHPRASEWDLFLFEVVVFALRPDGLPQTQAALKNYMLEWCSDRVNMREPLGEAAIEKKIQALYQFLKARGITPSGERLR